MKKLIAKIKRSAKAYVALVGTAATALIGLLPEPWNHYIQIVAALATAFGVYNTSNAPAEEFNDDNPPVGD